MLQKLVRIINNRRIYLFLGAVIIGVISNIRGFEWLFVLGLIPFFYYIEFLHKTKYKLSLIDFYIAGLIICLFAYSYLLELAPENWEFILPSDTAVIASLAAYIFACLFSALSFLIIPILLHKIRNKNIRLIFLPFVFMLAEILRSYLFSLISYGKGGNIGLSYNWGSVAVIASDLPLVYLSRLVGFYGLTFFALVFALASYSFLKQRLFIAMVSLFAVLVPLAISYYYLAPKTINKNITVSVVHLNEADRVDEWVNFNNINSKIDLIVFPEYSKVDKNPKFFELLSKLSKDGVIITTKQKGESPAATNDLVVYNKSGKIISRQSKQSLVPAGEYLPYSVGFALKIFGKQDQLNLFKYSQAIMPGSLALQNIKNNKFLVAALPCSGVLSPIDYKIMVNKGADIMVNTASLSLLKQDSSFDVFGYRMARFQAVYNSKPFLQSSRSGKSYIIDSNGKIVAISREQKSVVLKAKL